MIYSVDIPMDQLDDIVVQDLTDGYYYALYNDDTDLADAFKLVLERYYLTPSEWAEWKEKHRVCCSR